VQFYFLDMTYATRQNAAHQISMDDEKIIH
jgi:hypothetical protein